MKLVFLSFYFSLLSRTTESENTEIQLGLLVGDYSGSHLETELSLHFWKQMHLMKTVYWLLQFLHWLKRFLSLVLKKVIENCILLNSCMVHKYSTQKGVNWMTNSAPIEFIEFRFLILLRPQFTAVCDWFVSLCSNDTVRD